jgi:hypothetical protein
MKIRQAIFNFLRADSDTLYTSELISDKDIVFSLIDKLSINNSDFNTDTLFMTKKKGYTEQQVWDCVEYFIENTVSFEGYLRIVEENEDPNR